MTRDDATSELSSSVFVEEEETLSSLRGLQEVIGTKWLVSSLYADRGSHYWYTEEAGGNVDKGRLTQVHHAATTGHHADSRLFAGGAGSVGARLPHRAGPIA